jgi:hypothetical protein
MALPRIFVPGHRAPSPSAGEDGAALAAFQRGDPAAIERCYRECFDLIERALRPLLGPADRETVIHEVFSRLITNAEMRQSFQGESLGAWLATVSRNQGIDDLRRPRREVALPPGELHELVPALDGEVDTLARDLGQARARGVRTLLYVAYAGHGQVRDGIESLTLEDGPLTGGELLRDVVGRVGADRSHLLIDACNAYLLAFARGPGGEPRELHGFVELAAASQSGRVGYLLASTASGESHEWAGFQAGVFSHEVRSGLYGAADADGDGRVSYAEIAAFVTRANQVIANDRYRPQVVARAPEGSDTLIDLRARRDDGLRVGGGAL